MKPILILLLVAALAVLAWFTWRATRVMSDHLPPRTVCADQGEAWLQATAWALQHGGNAVAVLGTGSMAPYIPAAAAGRDPRQTVVAYVVTKPGATYADIKAGDLCLYLAERAPSLCVLHVAALQDAWGWIMSGLHNRTYENRVRVTPANFRGITAAVFTWNQ